MKNYNKKSIGGVYHPWNQQTLLEGKIHLISTLRKTQNIRHLFFIIFLDGLGKKERKIEGEKTKTKE